MNRKGKKRKGVNSHISMQTIKQYLQYGKYPKGCSPIDKRGIRKRSEGFRLDVDDELYYISRPKRLDDEPVDPNLADDRRNYRKAIMTVREQLVVTTRAHVGDSAVHKGTERTLQAVSSQYYWVGMSATVRQVTKGCSMCLANRQNAGSYESARPSFIAPAASNVIHSSNQLSEMQTQSDTTEKEIVKSVDGVENDMPETSGLPFTVTSQVENPAEEDPDLDFAVVGVLHDGTNMMEDSEVLKAQRFWERVEILVISSPSESKKKNYTIVALDSFSKWPEAKKLDKINEKTVSQFIIQLISRFGIMDRLVFLENDVFDDQSLSVSGVMRNLSMFNTIVVSEYYNPYDLNWTRLNNCLSQFVERYPNSWSTCLDLCLMPLRNSVAPKADYSPAFIAMGREPMLPSFLFPQKDSYSAEKMLSEEQIESATDLMITKYQDCCEADVKRVIAPADSVTLKVTTKPISIKEELAGVRKSARKVTLSQRFVDYEHSVSPIIEQKEQDMAVDNDNYNNSDKDEDMTQLIPLKKRKHTAAFGNDSQDMPAQTKRNVENPFRTNKKADGEDVINKLDSSTFYQIIKHYIMTGQYPLNSPMTFKRVVHKARELYTMEAGNLIYGKRHQVKKTVLITLKERLEILKEVHVSIDEHLTKNRMLEILEEKLVLWKGMGSDVDAYVKACPDCKHGKARPRVKRKYGKKWTKDQDSDDDGDDERWYLNEINQPGRVSVYPDLMEFLQTGSGPDHLTRSELVAFKKKAKNFKLVQGQLYYCASSTAKIKARKVLVTEEERLEVMKKAHGEIHNAPGVMLAEIKKLYYWRPMYTDIERYVGNCCQLEVESHKDKSDVELCQKIDLFAKYFNGEDIVSDEVNLDSLFPPMEVNTDVAITVESLNEITGQLVKKGEQEKEMECEDVSLSGVNSMTSEQKISTLPMTDKDGRLLLTSKASLATGVGLVVDSAAVSTPTDVLPPQQQPTSLAPELSTADQKEQQEFNEKTSVRIEMADGDDKLSRLDQGFEEEGEEEESEKGVLFKLVEKLKAKEKKSVKMRCDVCKKVIRGENNFKEHMYKHNGVKPFSCEICNKKLTSVKGMRLHMRKHTGHRPYLCSICGRGFPRSASLRYHIKTHEKAGTLPVICEICDRVFTSEHRLKKHTRFKHPEQRPVYICDACGKHFTAKRSLKRHEEAHQGIRRYVCEFCNRSFFRKEYLTYHLDSHYKDNPAMAHLTSKRKRRITQRQQSDKEENANILSIYTVEPEMGHEEVYTQLVEVTNPQGWTEGTAEVPTVFTLDRGSLQVSEVVHQADPGTALVMVEEGGATATTANQNQAMEIGHIIMSSAAASNSNQTTEPNNQIPAQHHHHQLHHHHHEIKSEEVTLIQHDYNGSNDVSVNIDNVNDQNNLQQESTIQIQVQQPQQHLDSQQQHHHHHHQQQQPQQQDTILATAATNTTTIATVADNTQATLASNDTTTNISNIANTNNNSSSGIILPPDDSNSSSRQIEVQMADGQKLTLSRTSGGAGGVDENGQEMVQYRVECLNGEALTETHLNAIQMLASSLLQ